MRLRILTDAPGQTCNRFWSYADSTGWAMEHGGHTLVLYWDKSIKYYDRLRHNRYVWFPLYSKRGISVLGYDRYNYWSHRLFPNNKIAAWFCYRSRLAAKAGFIQGWDTRGHTEHLLKYKKEIVQLFEPNRPIKEKVDILFRKARKEERFIIGVHMRKGDYKNFLKGKYYFDTTEYRDFMRQAAELYKDKHVCFYIATNEAYDHKALQEFDILPPDMGNAAYDLYALSLCDRIMGPISTFSRWASWTGNVPLCFLRRQVRIERDAQFSPVSDYYHFADGRSIISVKGLEDRYYRMMKFLKLRTNNSTSTFSRQ